MEDLEFKSNVKTKNKGKEFNRKTKNLWHRELTEKQIIKNCNILGLNLIKVNPVYTSFIGNMIHNFPDAVSSALEIGRRGIIKYKKGFSIYPDISLINQEKLNYLLGENIDVKGLTWIMLYKEISLLRYRNPIPIGLTVKNLYSKKSRVKVFIC